MAVFRDIDYNTRINGALSVSQDASISGTMSLGDIVDVEAEINKKLNTAGGSITGSLTVTGDLSVQGNILGVDLSQYYTKTNLETDGQSSIHWGNLTNIPSATTGLAGVVQLSSATNSTSTILAATASAVKTTYDLANSKWAYNENTIKAVKVNNAVNADTVNNLTVLTAVPAGAVFTDTIYTHPASHSIDIITDSASYVKMTPAERTKLLGIAENANNYIHPTSHSIDIINDSTSYVRMTPAERTKLEGLQNYIPPSSYSIDIITDSASYVRMTPAERTAISGLGSTYYSKAELQTSGSSSIHWGNLTNVPSYDNYSNWVLKVNSEGTGTNISSGGVVDIKGSGGTSVSRSSGVVTISSTAFTNGNGLNLSTGMFSIKLGTSPGLAVDANGLVNSDKGSSQLFFKTVNTSSGSAVATANQDSLSIFGSGKIATSASGKSITITHNDSDHTVFPTISGANTLSGINKYTSELILQPTSAPADVTTRISKTFSSDIIDLGVSVDALTEVLYKASTGTDKWEKESDYTINYKTGRITRVSSGGIASGGTVYVTYTPTTFVFKVKGSTTDNTDYLLIDNKGNLYGKSVTVNLTSSQESSSNDVQGDFVIQGNLGVNGQTTLGDATTDLTKINGTLSVYSGATPTFTVDNNGILSAGSVPWARLTSIPLSSATNSTSTTDVATSAAVKSAYDLANGKWTYNENTIKAVKVNNAVNADTVNGLTVLTAVPAGAVFTDTIYTHPSTHSADMIVDGTTNKVYTATEKTKLTGIEAGATADMTAAEILTAIKTVDGNGSGLDADTVDGYHHDSFVKYNEVIMNTNPFGGKRLYINSIDNAMYAASKKWFVTCTKHPIDYNSETYPKLNPDYPVNGQFTVTGSGSIYTVIEAPAVTDIIVYVGDTLHEIVETPTTGNNCSYSSGTITFGKTVTSPVYAYVNHTIPQYLDSPLVSSSSGDGLFDGSYEGGESVGIGHYMKIRISANEAGTAGFDGYPYGQFFLSYYYTNTPDKSEYRVYNRNYRPHGVGWKKMNFGDFNSTNTGSTYIQSVTDEGNYGRTVIEFIVYAHANHVSQVTEIDWKLTRPNLAKSGSTVTKYGTNKLYNSMYFGNQTTNNISLHANGYLEAIQFMSRATTGTAPFSVLSTTRVTNLNADKLDDQEGSYYLDWTNTTNKPSPVITVSGDATGSVTLSSLGSGTLSLTIADDSHDHVIGNVDGLQTALDGKVNNSRVLTDVPAGAVFTDTVYIHPNHSGDITSTGDGATIISDNAVTYAKIQDVSVTNRLLGRITAGAGTVEELTAANVRTIITDASNRFVTDTQITNFGTAYTHSQAAHAPSDAPSNATFTGHTGNTTIHITSAERTAWNAKSTLALGETSTTAYRGDYGKAAYDHVSSNGSSHTYINQDVTTAASPSFNKVTATNGFTTGGATIVYNAASKSIDFIFA